ncbi:MAG TPA: SRPBCC domain-containing protein [Gemmatimonadaceae bacterium]
MPNILHNLVVCAPADRVFAAISTPGGLNQWWTLTSDGEPVQGATFALGFGPGYDWRARVSRIDPARCFELELVEAMPDWLGTRVSFELDEASQGQTQLRFAHLGWAEASEHYRTSSFCWAMYLRLLRRAVEHGEVVPYEERLDA